MYCFKALIYFVGLGTLCSGFVLPDRAHGKLLKVPNGGNYGYWGHPEFCPEGTFASGYSMRIEGNQYFKDDTALNAIRLVCSDKDGHRNASHQISSTIGGYGSWTKTESCNQHFGEPSFMTSFQMQVEAPQSSGDDTTANFVNFHCRPFEIDENDNATETLLSVPPGHGHWGVWSDWSESCDPNQAICGINTKVEPDQGHGDDTSLNDVVFYCCDYEVELTSVVG